MIEKFIIFIVTIIAEVFLCVGLTVSLLHPKNRLWPPPKRNSWQYWYMWILTSLSTLGVIVLSILDSDTFFLTHWFRYVIGAILIMMGFIVELWGIKTLSFHTSLGLKSKFVTKGPYRYSRNPQYVGFILAFVGIIIVSNSILTFITGLFGILLFALTPFIEEPWLRKRFKKKYEDYCKRVPRFI